MLDPDQFPEALDSILKKYGKIWIWSILSAAVAALSVRSVNALNMVVLPLLNARGVPPFPPFSSAERSAAPEYFFFSLGVLLPSAATLASVWYLLQFLRHHILPILFAAPPSPEPGLYTDDELGPPPDGARLLYRAFGAVVIAMASELATALIAIFYRALV